MKKPTIFILLLILSISSFSQQTKQDYLQKSKNQKKAATILLGGGALLILTAFIIPRGEQTGTSYIIYTDYKNDGIKTALGLTGVVSVLGSIPFFIASGKNKRRAMNLSFRNERAPQVERSSFVYRTVPSLNLKINL